MKNFRAFLAAFGMFAIAACFSAPAYAAPLDLGYRQAAYADDWPPGIVHQVTAAPAVIERLDAVAPSTYRSRGPVGRTAHLFTASGRYALAHRSAPPLPT